MTTPTQDKIELSHYDLIDDFTLTEAACLIAGVDPSTSENTPHNFSFQKQTEVDAIEREMIADYKWARQLLSDIRYNQPNFAHQIHKNKRPPLLISKQMRAFMLFLSEGSKKKFAGYPPETVFKDIPNNPTNEIFTRKDITKWLKFKGYANDCYFLKDLPAYDSAKESDLQEQVKRLQGQVKQFENQAKELETLKQENAELKAKIEALSDGQNPDVDIASGLVFHHETQYLKLVSAVQERYYHPDRFDLTDKSTLPKKEDVKEWLIKNYRLTGAFADAVERVACPVDRAK
ncbi:MAG: hypothetical protein PHN76_05740 [Advenella sp.]|uniref:hypothetical protein n=1 Tax=Advenella sp. TaxID=1872388 RepID=UPI00258CA34B|nr:hypothetical protein [Advenella sp.]MDD3757647.1 hypothetical protein [Advenella sp.]